MPTVSDIALVVVGLGYGLVLAWMMVNPYGNDDDGAGAGGGSGSGLGGGAAALQHINDTTSPPPQQ